MRVQYIQHSGFLIETEQSCYLIDYYKGDLPRLEPDKPIVVCASHAHKDHYNPKVFDLLRQAGMRDIFAVLAKDIPKKNYPEGIDALCVRANETYTLKNGERLETLRSTDCGVAFLLTLGEGTIYHAGDLNDWFWEGESDEDNCRMRADYRREIDLLNGRSIDVAFVPLDPRLDAHYADGLLYFLAHVNAARVYPMHYWKKHGVIRRFLEEHPEYADVVADPEAKEKGRTQ